MKKHILTEEQKETKWIKRNKRRNLRQRLEAKNG